MCRKQFLWIPACTSLVLIDQRRGPHKLKFIFYAIHAAVHPHFHSTLSHIGGASYHNLLNSPTLYTHVNRIGSMHLKHWAYNRLQTWISSLLSLYLPWHFWPQGPPMWPICFQRQLSKSLDKNWMGYLAFLFTTLCLHFFIPMCQYACADVVDAAAVPQILHITAASDKCQYPLVIRDRNVTSASGLKWFGRVWRWQGFACEVGQSGLTGSPPNGAKKISSWFWVVSDERCTFPDYQNKHAPPHLNMQSIFEQLYSVEEIHNSSRIRAPRPIYMRPCIHLVDLDLPYQEFSCIQKIKLVEDHLHVNPSPHPLPWNDGLLVHWKLVYGERNWKLVPLKLNWRYLGSSIRD